MIKELEIALDNNCKLSCMYCLHKDMKDKYPIEYRDDVVSFIRRYALENKLDKIGFGTMDPLRKPERLKSFVESFNKNEMKFTLSSGGVNLNDNIIDWMNTWGVIFCLSYDGYNSAISRSLDVLDNVKYYFLKLDRKSVQLVLTKYSEEFDKHIQHIHNNLGYGFRINMRYLLPIKELDSRLYDFDFDVLEESFINIINNDYDTCGQFSTLTEMALSELANSNRYHLSCNYKFASILALDVQGRFRNPCTAEVIIDPGMISSYDEFLKYVDTYESYMKNYCDNMYEGSSCQTCKLNHICTVVPTFMKADKLENCFCKPKTLFYKCVYNVLGNKGYKVQNNILFK